QQGICQPERTDHACLDANDTQAVAPRQRVWSATKPGIDRREAGDVTEALAHGWLAVERFNEQAVRQQMRCLNSRRDTDDLWALIAELQSAVELLWGRPEYLLPDLVRLQSEKSDANPPGSDAHATIVTSIVNLHLAAGHAVAADRALS